MGTSGESSSCHVGAPLRTIIDAFAAHWFRFVRPLFTLWPYQVL